MDNGFACTILVVLISTKKSNEQFQIGISDS